MKKITINNGVHDTTYTISNPKLISCPDKHLEALIARIHNALICDTQDDMIKHANMQDQYAHLLIEARQMARTSLQSAIEHVINNI